MSDVINRLAICAEQRNFGSLLRGFMICSGYDPKITTTDLTPDQIKELELIAGDYPLRLSVQRIKETVRDYPFQLPIELCELYQKGNGCLPIGLGKEKNWDSLDNYFVFPNLDEPFYPLEEAMERYRALVAYREKYKYNIDRHLFPISEFEHRMHVVIGSEKQQETSPVFSLDTDWFQPRMEWPSLTNMMLAEAEIIERSLEHDMKESEAIWRKYGRVY